MPYDLLNEVSPKKSHNATLPLCRNESRVCLLALFFLVHSIYSGAPPVNLFYFRSLPSGSALFGVSGFCVSVDYFFVALFRFNVLSG